MALAVKARLARTLAAKDPERGRAMVADLGQGLTGALEDLRDLARGIYPPLLADQGLVAALEGQARKAALPVRVVAEGVGRYRQDAEAAVYFCCLEALQNIAKYANASAAVVRLVEAYGTLTFEVEDDGIGFNHSARGYGTGMQGMADRLAALGGELIVRSSPGSGTVPKLRWAFTSVRWTRLPHVPTSSSLLRRTNSDHVKSVSVVSGPAIVR